jgi:hypothetical protein
MTKYYSNKPDFTGDPAYPLLSSSSYFKSMSDIMDDIEAAGKVVTDEGVEDLYVQKGEASLGTTKDSSTFDKSLKRIYNMIMSGKKIHSDIMQNIDSKFTKGMDAAFTTLNDVNGANKPYKSKYTKKTVPTKVLAGYRSDNTAVYIDSTEQQSYNLADILDGKASPIQAAKDVYDDRIKAVKEMMAKKDQLSDEQIKALEGKSAEEIVAVRYPGQLPDYQRLKSSRYYEENKESLQYVDIGLKALAVLSMIGGTVLAPATSGASLYATYSGAAYLAADNAYSAFNGHTMITGNQLSTEERVWAGIDAVVTVFSMGSTAYFSSGVKGSTLLKGLATAGKHADNVNDVSKVIYSFATGQDPNAALQNLVLGQVMGIGMNAAGNYIGGKIGHSVPSVDVPSTKTSHLDIPLQGKQIPKLDPANVRLSSRQDLHLKASPADGTLAKLKTHPAVSADLPKMKQVSGDSATKAIGGVKPGDVDVPKVKAVSDVEAPKYDIERIKENIKESKLARESSGFKDFATRERYLEKVFNKLTPEERELIFNISKNAPKVEYQPDYSFDSVLSISKNNRPNVEYVYTPEYIKAHRQQFENGAIKFQKFTPEEGGYNKGAVGNEKDHVAFVMPKESGETLIKVTKGDPELLEDILGLHRGDLGSSPVAIEIPPESIKNPRIPSGNEDSAFDDFWKPGGKTFPGNMPEAVIGRSSVGRIYN